MHTVRRSFCTFSLVAFLALTAILPRTVAAQNGKGGDFPSPGGSVFLPYNPPDRAAEYPAHLYDASVILVDLDGEDYMDLVMAGRRVPQDFENPRITGYGGIFLHRTTLLPEDIGAPDTVRAYRIQSVPEFSDLYNAAIAVGDVNSDGKPDIAAMGRSVRLANRTALLMMQSDNGVFDVHEPGWTALDHASLDFGDYDNDGRIDLLTTGSIADFPLTRLYQNLGGGSFQQVDTSLPDVAFGDAKWGDSDNDGDLDILLSGIGEGGAFQTRLYLNERGEFVDSGVELPGLGFVRVEWADLNGDGLLDILMNGAEQSPFVLDGSFHIYLNLGSNQFEPLPNSIQGLFDGDFHVFDWNTDGDLDILVSGFSSAAGSRAAVLYTNTDGTFSREYPFFHTDDMSFAVGDYDRDSDLDLFVTGFSPEPFGLVNPTAMLLVSESPFMNEAPSIPSGLNHTIQGGRIRFNWNPAEDDITPSSSLSYSLRVGTNPDGTGFFSPLADPITGKRYVCDEGNVFHNTSWELTGLPPGTYYWSVQAVDQNCMGSPFAPAQSFTISGTITDSEDEVISSLELAVESVHPNPFADHTSIRVTLPRDQHVELAIFDVLGRSVRTLLSEMQRAGTHVVQWDGRDGSGEQVAPGLYLLRLTSGGVIASGSVMIVR